MEPNEESVSARPPGAWLLLLAAGTGFLGGIVGASVVGRGGQLWQRSPEADGREERGAGNIPAASSSVPLGAEPAIAVVENATPAVVAIVVSKELPRLEDVPYDPFGGGFFGPSPFRFRIRRDTGETERQDVGGGSGFIVSSDGLILTNKHVVSDPKAKYDAVFSNGDRVPATVATTDPLFDLALLKVERNNLPTLRLRDTDTIRVGQTVIAIGNALNAFPNSVSVGVVSGLGRQVRAGNLVSGEAETLSEVIQTDAAINPGNSGGPLLDLAGEVVGVNTAVAGSGAENIGFAIPAREAARVLKDFTEQGKVVRPILGVRYVLITPELQAELKLPVAAGALLSSGNGSGERAVLPDSAAEKAGLKEGDIILEVDGQKVTRQHTLQSLIRDKRPGDRITLTVLSAGGQKSVSVTLMEAR